MAWQLLNCTALLNFKIPAMKDPTIDVASMMRNANENLTADEQTGLKRQLADKCLELDGLQNPEPLARVRLQLDVAEILNALERGKEAWPIAHEAFVTAMQQEAWQDAVEACNVLYQAKQPDSRAVLGMGIWLAVTFPVDPELTLAMLMHVLDETPEDSDDAAVAAITARYVVDLRATDEQHESQRFLADNLIAMVAQRHGNVHDQAALDRWLDDLDLRDPRIFLPRLALVVNELVDNDWWFDREELRRRLPD